MIIRYAKLTIITCGVSWWLTFGSCGNCGSECESWAGNSSIYDGGGQEPTILDKQSVSACFSPNNQYNSMTSLNHNKSPQ